MDSNLQREHVRALLRVLDAHPAPPPGFGRVPPSWIDRLKQEAGVVRAMAELVTGRDVCLVHGRKISYFRGELRIDRRPTLRKLGRMLLDRRLVFPVYPRGDEGASSESLLAALRVRADEEIVARVGYNTAIVLFVDTPTGPAVVHVPTSDDGERLLRRHRRGLRSARALFGESELGELLPEPWEIRYPKTSPWFVQSRMPGQSLDLATIGESTFTRAIDLALRLVLSHDPARCGVAASIRRSPRQDIEPTVLRDAHVLLERLPEALRADVVLAASVLRNWWTGSGHSPVPVHGDYWLGNVLFDPEVSRVTGVVDWEWCDEAGIPGFDALQLTFMSSAVRHKTSFASQLVPIWSEGVTASSGESTLGRVSALAGMSRCDLQHVAIALWLDTLRRGFVETDPESDTWLKNMVEAPVRAIRRWVDATYG